MCRSAHRQTQETTTKTKTEIKGGRDVRVNGCLERRDNGDYLLTDARENRRQEPGRYALVTSEDLSKHVGHRVEIQGKVVENGNGSVTIESKTKTEVENGHDRETKTKTESTSSAVDIPLLGVKSMKTLSSTCN